MTQNNDAALPPVDVAGLVKEARRLAVLWEGDPQMVVGHKKLCELATALEWVARESDEADQWTGYFKKEHDDTIAAVGQQWFLDPLDGGNVGLPEGVKRIDDARKAAERERDEAREDAAKWRERAADRDHEAEQRARKQWDAEARNEVAQAHIAALEGALREIKTRAAECIGACQDVDDLGEIATAALAQTGGDGWLPIESAPKDGALGEIADNNAARLLRQCYVTLAFAFRRLHESSRSRDGELCLDFQKVRAQIEDHFKKIGVKL